MHFQSTVASILMVLAVGTNAFEDPAQIRGPNLDYFPSPETGNLHPLGALVDCGTEVQGYGPASSPDTAAAFQANTAYGVIAGQAGQEPSYTWLGGSINGTNASALAPQNKYVGWYNLPSYNSTQCATYCNATASCNSFNMFFHRTPSITPSTNSLSVCYNPASTVLIVCALWNTSITIPQMIPPTNRGEMRGGFTVLVQGSRVWNGN